MPSRRYRSRKTLGGRINKIRYSVSKTDNTSIPSVVGNNAVNSESLARNAVSTDFIAGGAVDATTYGSVAFIPSGETNQRVPAPLNEPLYWTKVVEGRVELHRSGIHGSGELEDIQHVTAETDGLKFDATTGEDARIYLTGRLDLPKSRKVYGTWKSDLPIDVKLVYWVQNPTHFVESGYRLEGVTHIDVSNTSHVLAKGDSIRVIDTTTDFNGLYKVVAVQPDYIKATSYQNNYTLTVADSAFVASTNTATFTFSSVNTTTTVVRAGDLIVLDDVSGDDKYEGYFRIDTVDDTTTVDTIVLTFSVNGEADVDDLYNGETVAIYTETGTDSVNYQYFSPFGKVSKDEYHYVNLEERTIWGADGYTIPVQSVSLTNNIASVTTEFANYLQTGDSVKIIGVDGRLSTPPTDPVFDGEHTVTSSNATAHSFTFSMTTGDVALESNLVGSIAVTSNQYVPEQYAVYAEVPFSENSIRTLSEAKVFEVVGEPSTKTVYYNVTNVELTSNLATLTLDSSAPDVGSINVNLNDESLSAVFDGTYTVSGVSANTISYALVNVNVASQSSTGIVSAVVGSRHSELSPNGLVFYGADGSVESRFGSEGLDRVSLSNASIDVTGVGTFTNVVSTGMTVSGDATFGSTVSVSGDIAINSDAQATNYNLYGTYDAARYHIVANAATNSPYTQTNSFASYTGDILNRFPRGLVYASDFGPLVSSTFTATADRYTWAAGSFTLDPFRNYLFVISFGEVHIGTASNTASRVEFIASNNVLATGEYALNTMSSTNAVHIKYATEFPANYAGPIPDMMFQYTTTNAAVTNGVSSTLIQGGQEIFWQIRYTYQAVLTRTNTVFTEQETTSQGRFSMAIYDMGVASLNQIGYSTYGESKWVNTGNVVSGGAVGTTTITVTGNATANALSSAYYDNYGKGDSGTTDPYANERSLYQGNPGTSSGTKKSQIVFPTVQTVVGSTIYSKSNFTVTNIEIYLRNRHSYLAGGLSTKIGFATSGSLGTSVATGNGATPVSTTFTKGQGKWVAMSSAIRANIVSETTTWSALISLLSGTGTFDSTISNYGYFDGALLSDPPRIRVTYTYQETV